MRFAVSDEAAALRDAAADLLAGEVPAAVVRAGWSADGAAGPVAAAWRKLAGVGVVGTLVAEHRGGLGLDENALVPLLEAVGYSGLPVPAAETIAVAAPLLPEPLLPGVLNGGVLVAAQLGDGALVPYATRANLIVLRAGTALRLYERGELAMQPQRTVDGSRALARVTRPAAGGRVLTDDPASLAAAWQRGVLGTSALLTGLAGRLLELTVGYVRQRQQFGVPIGSFQAIKHALANALLALEFARPAVLAAGWAQAARAADAPMRTSAAKVLASDAAGLMARTAIQCHGAMGYTTEYDLHLFAKQVWALTPSWGSARWHRAELAETLGV